MRRPSAERRRALAWQALFSAVLVLAAALLAIHVGAELQARGIRSGFAFLFEPAGFAIGESPIEFDSGEPYWRAFLAGLGNTLRVAAAGIVFASLLGLLAGAGRLAGNFLLRSLSRAYIGFFRNIPLLLQLLAWYFLLTEYLPPAVEALQPLPGVFLSKSGLALPWAGESPVRAGFGIEGGVSLTPEFLAVLLALSCYAGAYLAEIVRAGILSVPRGQLDAAAALGLAPHQRFLAVVLPQALRLMLPPATSQYLNLTKNSSLAVVVGYPDLVSVANTSLNQTGQAMECIAVVVAVYLGLSLATAALSGLFEARLERRR